MRQYLIVGRRKPTIPKVLTDVVDGKRTVVETKPNSAAGPVYRMKLFAPNSVIARSRFWYYLASLKKIKRSNGEIVEIHEIFERNPSTIKNFGFWLRYDSRSGTHNMYKEYRDVTINRAVKKMYADLASRHRARTSSIQIIKTGVIKAKLTKRASTQQFHNSSLSFRLLHRIPRASSRTFRTTFSATRPTTFF